MEKKTQPTNMHPSWEKYNRQCFVYCLGEITPEPKRDAVTLREAERRFESRRIIHLRARCEEKKVFEWSIDASSLQAS